MRKNEELKLYRVIPKYIDALRDKDNGGDESVYIVDGNKASRPFIGIVFLCNRQKYCIPLTSYKERFKYLTAKEPDFTPIYRGGKMVAGIEFNKMIPIVENQIRELDMTPHKHDTLLQKREKELRKYEHCWCNEHRESIIEKAQKLYTMYVTCDDTYRNRKYCLNFPELEKICQRYEKEHPAQHFPSVDRSPCPSQ